MKEQQLQIYEWDNIDIKMKQKLSKTHYNLYNRIKSSKQSRTYLKANKKQQVLTSQLIKKKEDIYKFLQKKQSKQMLKKYLTLKSQHSKQNIKQKNPKELSKSLIVRQYNSPNQNVDNEVQKENQTTLNKAGISISRNCFILQRSFSQKSSKKVSRSMVSTQSSDKSLTKTQLKKKYSSLSNSLVVKKVQPMEIGKKSEKLNLSLPQKQGQMSKPQSQSKFQSKYSGIKTDPEYFEPLNKPLANQSHHFRNFLETAFLHKKCLKL